MGYIEVQDKKLKFRIKKKEKKKEKELQSVLFDWYSIDRKSYISKKLANVKSP